MGGSGVANESHCQIRIYCGRFCCRESTAMMHRRLREDDSEG